MKYEQPFDQPSNPDAHYVNGDESAGIEGSIPSAAAFENHLRELAALITAAGFMPSASDLKQIIRAIRQDVRYCVATQVGGNPNALQTVTTANGAPALTAYQAGLALDVKIPADNTGAATIAVDGLATVSIVRANGANVGASELVSGQIVRLIYDGTRFQLGFGFSAASTTNNITIDIPFADDTSVTPNTVTAAYSPAITVLAKGDIISTKLKNTFTGAANILVNALTAKAILRPDSTPTQRNDAFVNEMLLLAYDGTSFQIVNQVGVPPLPALVAVADWYVNTTTGNDSTLDGTSATVSGSHGPFKTVQRAVNETAKYNMNGHDQNIHIANANYIEAVVCGQTNGAGTVNFIGQAVGGCGITGTAGRTALFISGGNYSVDQLTLAYGGGAVVPGDPGDCLAIVNNAVVAIKNVAFTAASRAHMSAGSGARVTLRDGTIYINSAANAQHHILCESNAAITIPANVSTSWPFLNVMGPISLSAAFCSVSYSALVQLLYQSITGFGNVSGLKYNVSTNANLSVFSQGVNYLPGTIAGTTSTGGQYT